MTDIVNDLRTALAERQKVMKGGGELYRRAADEIERLRDVNDQSTAALEAAERRAEEAERELQVAEDQANTIAGDLAQAELERDNWKMSAEEATRAERRWKDCAVEAERERDRLDEAFDRDLPWRYDEVEAQRNQLAAVVEKVRAADSASSSWDHFGHLVMDILATAPDDALREHDAALIEGLADEVHATLSDPNRKRPRDPRGEFATDLLNDVAWAVHLIREKARQRREEQGS